MSNIQNIALGSKLIAVRISRQNGLFCRETFGEGREVAWWSNRYRANSFHDRPRNADRVNFHGTPPVLPLSFRGG
jgi:hypothetical protein